MYTFATSYIWQQVVDWFFYTEKKYDPDGPVALPFVAEVSLCRTSPSNDSRMEHAYWSDRLFSSGSNQLPVRDVRIAPLDDERWSLNYKTLLKMHPWMMLQSNKLFFLQKQNINYFFFFIWIRLWNYNKKELAITSINFVIPFETNIIYFVWLTHNFPKFPTKQ